MQQQGPGVTFSPLRYLPENTVAVMLSMLCCAVACCACCAATGLQVAKRVQADWRLVLGESAVDIRVGRVSAGLQREYLLQGRARGVAGHLAAMQLNDSC